MGEKKWIKIFLDTLSISKNQALQLTEQEGATGEAGQEGATGGTGQEGATGESGQERATGGTGQEGHLPPVFNLVLLIQ